MCRDSKQKLRWQRGVEGLLNKSNLKVQVQEIGTQNWGEKWEREILRFQIKKEKHSGISTSVKKQLTEPSHLTDVDRKYYSHVRN